MSNAMTSSINSNVGDPQDTIPPVR